MNTTYNTYDPLFHGLFKIALPLMEGYQTDLGHDTIALTHAKEGDRILWGVRPHGTEFRVLPADHDERMAVIRTTTKLFNNHHWFLVEVTSTRADGYCGGTVTPLTKALEDIPVRDRTALERARFTKAHEALHAVLDPMHHQPAVPGWYGLPDEWEMGETVHHLPTPAQEQQAARLQELIKDDPFADNDKD
jgi:hypothetical protein